MQQRRVRNLKSKLLSNNWYTLNKYTFDYQKRDGTWQQQEREAYDRGNGAVILLYNKSAKTVILTRQFRLPTYVNGNPSGMLIEACAGLLDADNPEECIKRETIEETGYEIKEVEKVYEVYMSPGSVTEILYFFIAEYTPKDKIAAGGGAENEQEDIETLELQIDEAMQMVKTGEIKDAKTIMLLQYLLLSKKLDD
ncbi:MAG: GDP-mannose pyrophosphatase NudK [Bacteroidota bacterium]